MPGRYAVLLDGGFVRRKLEGLKRRAAGAESAAGRSSESYFPTAEEILGYVGQLVAHPRLAGMELLRIYFYDAPPLRGTEKLPISRKSIDFGAHPSYALNRRLQDTLAQSPDVALRRGELAFRGWKVSREALADLEREPRPLRPEDFVPEIEQKGVDLRLGLDMAVLAIKRIVDIAVLVTGDADLVPAMKLARREGLRVYLDPMGNPVRPSLTEHADFVLRVT